ncbi:MAG: DUF3795 domain-containing protein [Breznakibacter sp.]|nr:DUF3795 domain-containing protein [Breznakibacter sp.]
MKEIVANKELIAYCGLHCGACRKYLNNKCPGCKENTKAAWCKIRTCNMDAKTNSCAECTQITLNDCKTFNNPIGKIFGFIFQSDRKACIQMIKERGADSFALEMTSRKAQTIKRGSK